MAAAATRSRRCFTAHTSSRGRTTSRSATTTCFPPSSRCTACPRPATRRTHPPSCLFGAGKPLPGRAPPRAVAILCRMVAALVPIRLSLPEGDRYTLWAPRWRDEGDEWEAFLGKDEDLYVFESVADLVAFVRTNKDNDLTDHPAWAKTTEANAHRLDPVEEHQYDIIGVPELAAEKPSEDTIAELHRTLVVTYALGSVCELPAINKLFNGNPVLANTGGGIEAFSGRV